ncbi:MAG: ATP-binding cassette domain-containing protein [Oscillospiraceae bacterium]
MEILNVKKLSFTYPNCDLKCLDDISFTVEKGDLVLLCGASGCGKTTLLKLLKSQISPFGKTDGAVEFCNNNINDLDEATTAFDIGFVMQNPDAQIVSDKVFSELTFGLLNMGLSNYEIQIRICEVSDFFGISELFEKDISTLSGGQKQLLNLASIIAMNPKLLILDEPTAQLDPISSAHFFDVLSRLNRELGTTIIIAEHRLNELWPIADKILLLDNGQLLLSKPPKEAAQCIKSSHKDNAILNELPCAVQLFNELDANCECPLSVRDGIRFLDNNFKNDIKSLERADYKHSDQVVLELCDVFARYEKNLPDILNGVNFKVFNGECVCILGSNGAGKSTMLRACAGLIKPCSGKLKVFSKKISQFKDNSLYDFVSLLPQNPLELFLCQSVLEDLLQVNEKKKRSKSEFKKLVDDVCELLDITHLLLMHPYDLSGGQLQKSALAKLLLLEPQLLLLDEPVKGLDACAKLELAQIFRKLTQKGISIVIVTHDVEFASICADRCAMFWGGKVVSADVPYKFFSENKFYTTAASRISRHFFNNAVTCNDVIALCKENGVV